MDCCTIFKVFNQKEMGIKQYHYWSLLLRNRNTTLGNCVIITHTHHEAMSDLSTQEMEELLLIIKELEPALQKAFKYDSMNYQILMMQDKHTHITVIPRYAKKKKFAGIHWTDDTYPKSPGPKKDDISPSILLQVKKMISDNLLSAKK